MRILKDVDREAIIDDDTERRIVTAMHSGDLLFNVAQLDRDEVLALIDHLGHWVNTGHLDLSTPIVTDQGGVPVQTEPETDPGWA